VFVAAPQALDQVCACAAAGAQAANPDAVGITATAISTFGTCPGADFARERERDKRVRKRSKRRWKTENRTNQ
jgi:hypothetical protein